MSLEHAEERTAYTFAQGMHVVVVMALVTFALGMVHLPLNVVVDPVRKAFGISDVQASLLMGLAYSAPFTLMSLAGGWLSDRMRRRTLLSAGMVLWSAAAVLGALAHSFEGLLLSRVLVAVGAGCKMPVAMTWVNDAFPPGQRGRAIGAFFMVMGIGPALAITLPGLVLRLAEGGAFAGWPLLSTLDPWRLTLLLLALPTLLLLPLVWGLRDIRSVYLVEESRLDGTQPQEVAAPASIAIAPTPGLFGLLGLSAGLLLMETFDIANISWMPTIFKRVYGYDAAQAGMVFGVVTMVAGTVGPIVGGFLGDRAFKSHGVAGRLWVCAAASLACIPLLSAYLQARPLVLASALTACGILTVMVISLGFVSVQAMLPPERRGFGTGVLSAGIELLGSTGPTLTALVAQHMLSGPAALAHSVAAICALTALLTSIVFCVTARSSSRLGSSEEVTARAA